MDSDNNKKNNAEEGNANKEKGEAIVKDATDRVNLGSKEKETKSGTSKGDADFDSPDDDPA